MKEKSLRQVAKELGVSASYLSQVRHGKRRASHKVLSKVQQSVKQNAEENDIISSIFLFGEVSEMADEHDLGSCAARRGGSNPPFPTQGFQPAYEAGQLFAQILLLPLDYPSFWGRVSPC